MAKSRKEQECQSDSSSLSESTSESSLSLKSKKIKKPPKKHYVPLEYMDNSEGTIVVTERTIVKANKGLKWSEIPSYCRPGQVLSLLNDLKENKPTELGVIESFGFGGLLTLRLSEFTREMLPSLVESFDPNGHLFIAVKGIKEFAVTKHDCRDVFLLPCSDIPVELNTVSAKKEEYSYVKELKELLGLPSSEISVPQLRDSLLALPEGDSRFIQMFILYVCSVFFAPTSSQKINFSISKSLLNLEMIPKLDWCSYVLNDLCYSIKVFKGEIKSKRTEKKRITGCLLLLQILYFHRFMFRGVKEPSDLPLIQHWDDKKVKERLKNEKFGLAMFDNSTYPVSSKSTVSLQSVNVVQEVGRSAILVGEVRYQNVTSGINEADKLQVGSSSKRYVEYELPDHLETDEEIANKAPNDRQLKRVEEMKETSNKADADPFSNLF